MNGTIYSLDVWGNPDYGFEVNDMFNLGTYEDAPSFKDSTNQDILTWLNVNYFAKPVDMDKVYFEEWDESSILLREKATGKPIVVAELP